MTSPEVVRERFAKVTSELQVWGSSSKRWWVGDDDENLGAETPRIFLELCTPPKFNITPENGWLEDYFPFGKVTFQGLC